MIMKASLNKKIKKSWIDDFNIIVWTNLKIISSWKTLIFLKINEAWPDNKKALIFFNILVWK